MATYAVYSPAFDGDPATAFDRARAIRLGFAPWALVFGPLWLLANQLWLALAAWIAGAALVEVAVGQGGLGPAAATTLYWLAAVFLGFEGRNLQGAALARAGRPLVDLVEAADEQDAEYRFLARALSAAPAPRPANRPARTPPPPPGGPHVIGLFPEAGR